MALAPSKGNLLALKRSRSLALTGFDLMDRKRNILVRELMALIDQARDLQKRVDSTFEAAYAALDIALISAGDCEQFAEAVPVDNGLGLRFRSVMGVELPMISASSEKSGLLPYGLTETDSRLDAAYVEFRRVKLLLRDLAETENAIFRLAYSIRKTQKRANALENIVIPGLDDSIVKIIGELEEKEREEFVRQKVIKSQKIRQGGW